MTEEYKKILFNSIMGNINNLTPHTPSTDEIILQNQNITIDLMSYLTNATDYNVNGIIEGSNNFVMYGGYNTNNDTWLGFIALLDDNFNLVDVITQFNSGTPLRTICSLEMAEDNTFYGVDYEGTNTSRFIMLNNFTIPNGLGNYEVKLRTSYNFNDNDFLAQIGTKIFKNPNSSHYVFIGETESDFTLKIIELKVNVGSANEWTSYNSPNYEFYMNGYVDFDTNDNAYISTVGINPSKQVRRVYKDYTATTLNSTLIETATGDPYMYGNSPVAFIGKNNFYYIWTDNDTGNTYIKQYNGSVSSIQTLSYANVFITSKNGELYIGYDYSPNGSLTASQFYYQRYSGTWSPIAIPNYNSYIQDGYMFIVNQYNLLKIFTFDNLNTLQILGELLTEDYNPSNYNSSPYYDITSVVPQKARLYSGGNLVFARNDYNVSCLGNSYTATVEVPNVYLNGNSITPTQLVSQTNQVIVNYTPALVKNIYEKVYLNFTNSINAYDEDTGNVFDTTALVKNISGLGNTNHIEMSYYFTSKDGVVVDHGVVSNVYMFSRLSARIEIGYFTATGDADKLCYCNYDREVYGYINYNFKTGKQYKITQFVRLADIPEGLQNVLYNNNQVQYNGNDVFYITSI